MLSLSRFLVFSRRSVCWALAVLTVFAMPVQAQSPAPLKLALIEGLSGPFGNTGEAVVRNIAWAVERVNARGGIKTPQGMQAMVLERYDSKGQSEEALSALKSAIDDGAQVVMQGNSSANAAALIDAINKHNEREPAKRVLFLNYSAVDPALTNEKCSFWHFRFDAHADMRMTALMQVLREDKTVKSAYLIGQDYSFGQAVLREAKRQLAEKRPDVKIAGEELHPMGRVKDFLPYAAKIKASGAQAVITGNWGNDLTLLVKAAREAGYEGKFYTFYGNAMGVARSHWRSGCGPRDCRGRLAAQCAGQGQRGLLPIFPPAFPQTFRRLCARAHAAHGRGLGPGRGKGGQHRACGRGLATGKIPRQHGRANRQHAGRRPSVSASFGGGRDGAPGDTRCAL
jgi:branched-chain amino acid transport system substrate-binding protein